MTEKMHKSEIEHPEGAFADHVHELSCLDIQGGGQVCVHNGYAYIGHMTPPDGTSVVDVSDPNHPKVVATIPPPDEYSHTHKVRVAGNLMITNVEQHRRHFYRRGAHLVAPDARVPSAAPVSTGPFRGVCRQHKGVGFLGYVQTVLYLGLRYRCGNTTGGNRGR